MEETKWTVKTIIEDGANWTRYQEAYEDEITAHQIREVEKMMGCGDRRNGYASYICLTCGEKKDVPFTCKSRICSSCGKAHADNWAEQMSSRMINVTHRHMTFTIAAELWPLLEAEPEGRKVLFEAVNATLRKVMKGEPGIVMVLHPYGKDLKVNYHVHGVVTEGGLNDKGEWIEQPYVNYEALRKIWQYECLTRLRSVLAEQPDSGRLINQLFERYKNGFYVHAEPRVTSGEGIGRYIGRYIRHPAIADARIVSYDGQEVTFFYEDHEGQRHEQTVPVLEFMHGVIRHIPPKHFKMVRYYGLYAPRKATQVRTIMEQIGKKIGRVIRRLTWRQRIQRDFGQDPLCCSCCGAPDMELYSLTVRWRGRLKTIGGMSWLFERGCLIATPPDNQPHSTFSQSPSAYQLAFGF